MLSGDSRVSRKNEPVTTGRRGLKDADEDDGAGKMHEMQMISVVPRDRPKSILHVDNVTLQYKTPVNLVTATYRVCFDVYEADRFVILGQSGCGKSTLLKAVGGYMRPTEGSIRLHGVDITAPGPDRVMVFQEFDQLLPWKTVRENILFAFSASGRFKGNDAQQRADYFIEKVGLSKFSSSYPHTLSGGMKQRVAIARGLAMEPKILLMDEPFASLDALTRRKMQEELLQLWNETHVTIFFVTHSIEEAVRLGNRILLMSPHPGQVRAEFNGLPARASEADATALERRIHEILFER
jgi:NitT/TauT family transport system ATP-binding protein